MLDLSSLAFLSAWTFEIGGEDTFHMVASKIPFFFNFNIKTSRELEDPKSSNASHQNPTINTTHRTFRHQNKSNGTKRHVRSTTGS
jgi:hypothetical protein